MGHSEGTQYELHWCLPLLWPGYYGQLWSLSSTWTVYPLSYLNLISWLISIVSSAWVTKALTQNELVANHERKTGLQLLSRLLSTVVCRPPQWSNFLNEHQLSQWVYNAERRSVTQIIACLYRVSFHTFLFPWRLSDSVLICHQHYMKVFHHTLKLSITPDEVSAAAVCLRGTWTFNPMIFDLLLNTNRWLDCERLWQMRYSHDRVSGFREGVSLIMNVYICCVNISLASLLFFYCLHLYSTNSLIDCVMLVFRVAQNSVDAAKA